MLPGARDAFEGVGEGAAVRTADQANTPNITQNAERVQDMLYLATQGAYQKIQELLRVEARKRQHRAIFVQVGANDGKKNDPLHGIRKNYKDWLGVQVEPQPEYFRRIERHDEWGYANLAMKENCNNQANTSFWVYGGDKTDKPVKNWPVKILQRTFFD